MGPYAFAKLCEILRGTGRLKDNRNASVEEQVAKFLYILAHNERIRTDCVGAINGTHIRVKVSVIDAPRYRGRKEYTTQNVLAACDFDMRFTYVLPGWEGTASNSRIIKKALSREDKLIIPRGKYYLVDAGFMQRSGLMAPYRGVRYHLKEYSARGPENAEEIFNHRHSSLRNVIERRFVDTVTEIILACCILHNYLMGVDPDERLNVEVDQDISNGDIYNEARNSTNDSDADARRGAILRISIATRMWNDYSLKMSKTLKKRTDSEAKASNMRWIDDMDGFLLNVMLEEQNNGNRPNGTWSSHAYANMSKKCSTEFGYAIEKGNIKNRIKTLKGTFNSCHDLFKNMSGFAWNPITGLFEVEDEVWEPLIEANPNAKKWKRTPIQHYEKMFNLFSEDRANGEGSKGAKEKVRRWEKVRDDSVYLEENFDCFDEFSMPNVESYSPMVSPSYSCETSSKKAKKTPQMVEMLEKKMEIFQSGIDNVAASIRQGNEIAKEGLAIMVQGHEIAKEGLAIMEKGRPRCYSEDEVFSELVKIGIPTETQLDAMLFLIKVPAIMREFFGVPTSELRRQILLKMMYAKDL
ncbi:hypothetical protein SO802_012858 [Lithocarpus litseifolius]|uniref:Myb/SANT-like domain-containing protein n=1 Tax=Lithocarpus litseifolius TaxID=425828 RepID=A0AAW2D658_9ROSI